MNQNIDIHAIEQERGMREQDSHPFFILFVFTFAILFCATAITTAMTAALLGARTADTAPAAFLGSEQIPNNAAGNCRENHDNDKVFHHVFISLHRSKRIQLSAFCLYSI